MSEAAAAPAASDVATPAAEAPPGGAPAAEGDPAAGATVVDPAAPVVEKPAPEPEHKLATRNIELTRELREVTARAKGLEEKAGLVDRLRTMVANNDFEGVHEELGTSYKEITDYYAGQEDDSPAGRDIADLKKWKAEREARDQEQASAEVRAMHVANAERAVKADAAKYKLCARRGDRALPDGKSVAETAVEAVAYAWKADGSPTLDQAGYNGYLARAFEGIEGFLADELRSMADPPAPAPAVVAAPAAAAPPARAASAREAVRAAAAEQGAVTLTRDSVSGPVGGAPPVRSKSAREAAAEWAAEHGAS